MKSKATFLISVLSIVATFSTMYPAECCISSYYNESSTMDYKYEYQHEAPTAQPYMSPATQFACWMAVITAITAFEIGREYQKDHQTCVCHTLSTIAQKISAQLTLHHTTGL
jgi:hypothetical protein